MQFKNKDLKGQFLRLPKILQDIAIRMNHLFQDLNKPMVITRIFGKIEGSSGVHEAGRAFDVRNEYFDEHGKQKRLLNEDEVAFVIGEISKDFPRRDHVSRIIHHSFNGGPYHFHVQCGAHETMIDYRERIKLKWGKILRSDH